MVNYKEKPVVFHKKICILPNSKGKEYVYTNEN